MRSPNPRHFGLFGIKQILVFIECTTQTLVFNYKYNSIQKFGYENVLGFGQNTGKTQRQ